MAKVADCGSAYKRSKQLEKGGLQIINLLSEKTSKSET